MYKCTHYSKTYFDLCYSVSPTCQLLRYATEIFIFGELVSVYITYLSVDKTVAWNLLQWLL